MADEEDGKKKAKKKERDSPQSAMARVTLNLPPGILNQVKEAHESFATAVLPSLLFARAMQEDMKIALKAMASAGRVLDIANTVKVPKPFTDGMLSKMDVPAVAAGPRPEQIQLARIEKKQDEVLRIVSEIYKLLTSEGDLSPEQKEKLKKMWAEAEKILYS